MSDAFAILAREIACSSIRDAGLKYSFPNRCPTPDVAHTEICDRLTVLVEQTLRVYERKHDAAVIIAAARSRGAKIGYATAVILTEVIASTMPVADDR